MNIYLVEIRSKHIYSTHFYKLVKANTEKEAEIKIKKIYDDDNVNIIIHETIE